MSKYTYCQIQKIDLDKWYEGVRMQRDPGQRFILEWIDRNAAWFREAWNNSLCQTCSNWRNCGHQVLQGCEFYQKESE